MWTIFFTGFSVDVFAYSSIILVGTESTAMGVFKPTKQPETPNRCVVYRKHLLLGCCVISNYRRIDDEWINFMQQWVGPARIPDTRCDVQTGYMLFGRGETQMDTAHQRIFWMICFCL